MGIKDDDAWTARMEEYLDQLPTYSGKSNEDIIQWLKVITDGLTYANFNDDQKLTVVSTYIMGDARRWLLHNMSILDSWPTFIQEIRKMFAPTLLKEVPVSRINEYVKALDGKPYYDNNIKDEQKYELVNEKEENLDYLATTLGERDNIVSVNTCSTESSENNFETDWPNGGELWFIHDELPQRLHFIQSRQQEVVVSLIPNIDNDFAREKLPGSINVVLSSIINDTVSYTSDDGQAFSSLLKLHELYTDVISFILLLGGLATIVITSGRMFTGGKTTPYCYRNVMSCHTEDRDWFRLLAVP